MKIKKEFVLHQIADENIVVPIGECGEALHGVFSLNQSGAFLWKCLESEQTVESLKVQLMQEYQISDSIAEQDANLFIRLLTEYGCLIN